MDDPYRDYKLQSEAKTAAFDKLPRSVRRALVESQFNWDVEQLLAMWNGGHSVIARHIVQLIKRDYAERLRDRMR